MPKVGVFGGTFDPVHLGHLAAAERVRCDLELEQVIFVPANISPFKLGHRHSASRHRLHMVQLAVRDNPHFGVSEIELERGGTSYTVDTIELLKAQKPDDELYFIMGMDSLLDLNGWKDVDRLIRMCRLVVVTRPGYEISREQLNLLGLPALVWERTTFLEVPGLDIASTDLRERIRRGQSVRYLLTSEVETYIRENGLYNF